MKVLLFALTYAAFAVSNAAIAQYSEPNASSGYDWREQRGSQDWRNNTWREQRFDQDWRHNDWRQQRLNEDPQQRQQYLNERTPNSAADRGYAKETPTKKKSVEKTQCGVDVAGKPIPCYTPAPGATVPTTGVNGQ